MKTTRTVVVLGLALGMATEVVKADFTFGTPTNLGPAINSSAIEIDPSISADGLELFFESRRVVCYISEILEKAVDCRLAQLVIPAKAGVQALQLYYV